MPEYITTGTLFRDGELHEPGERVELSGDEAEGLLELGAIREPGEPGGATRSEVEQLEDQVAELEDKLAEAGGEHPPLAPGTVEEIKAILPQVSDLDRLKAAIEYEEQNADRSSALTALQERVDEVASESDDGDEG